MTNAILLHRMQAIDSCVESVDWARELKLPDMHSAWMAMDQPQWMCWVAVRILHAQAMKAVVMSVKQLGPLLPPAAVATLDASLAFSDGKTPARENEEEALLTAAFDAASTALHVAGPLGSALLAVSYVAHAAHKLRTRAALEATPDNKRERKRLSLRASNHVADALLHVLLAAPDLADKQPEKLPNLIRSHIDERALSKAWHAIPEAPKATDRATR